jgi:putative oxidoreductase
LPRETGSDEVQEPTMTGQPVNQPGIATETVEITETTVTTPATIVERHELREPRDWFFGTSCSPAPTILRLVLAVVMFAHGAQKVLGWFGGAGLAATIDQFTKQMGLPLIIAYFVIGTEFVGSILLFFGLLTRLTALGFVGLMIGAIALVHAKNGFFMNWFGKQAGEGYEYHLLVIGMALALMVAGGGWLSADRAITKARSR